MAVPAHIVLPSPTNPFMRYKTAYTLFILGASVCWPDSVPHFSCGRQQKEKCPRSRMHFSILAREIQLQRWENDPDPCSLLALPLRVQFQLVAFMQPALCWEREWNQQFSQVFVIGFGMRTWHWTTSNLKRLPAHRNLFRNGFSATSPCVDANCM